jgi:2-polyprenyl-3-methyl-5-hydroxy-6-metoxy-1,4-benzoquinol methylase
MSSNALIELEAADCPLGCPRDDEKVLTGRDRLHDLPGEFTVVRCRTCGLMRTDPRPSARTIGFYYPPDYGPYLYTQVGAASEERDLRPRWRRGLSRLVQAAVRVNAERLPAMNPGRMLEIGCASGAFLHRMAAAGWQAEGIEFSESAAAAARRLGYRVDTGQLEVAPDRPERYGLVVGWMVLEHLHDPIPALKKLWSWTKPGGWLVVSVPNADCYEFALFRDAWFALQLPTHLYHFTPETLAKLLDRSGWRLEKIFYQRDLRNLLGSLSYVFSDRGIFQRLARRFSGFPERGGRLSLLLHPLALALSALGQTGRMTVWARRVDR